MTTRNGEMQTAKRYDNTSDDTWVEAKDGEFVTIDDYNELYKRYIELIRGKYERATKRI